MYLQSSVSNLQRLFSGAPTSRSPHLDSVIEESETTRLLFPEGLSGTASNSDDTIQSPCDIRIVIAQDGVGISQQKILLYDSHPAPQPHNSPPSSATPNRQRAGSFTGIGGLTGGLGNKAITNQPRTAPHSRQSSQSVLTSPLSPVSELGGLFGNSVESHQCKLAREGREETDSLLKCMFGTSSGLPCTSSTTKLHVRPPKHASSYDERPSSAARESPVVAGFPKRRTPLTRSTTAGDLQSEGSQKIPRQNSSAIWITRLFSIELESHHDLSNLEAERFTIQPKRKGNVERRKAPPIAIAVVLQTSGNRQRPPTPFTHRSSGSSSSSPRTWSFDGLSNTNVAGLESGNDLENVTVHWSVIDRALREIQTIARYSIKAIQRSTQLASRTLQLPANALQELPLFPAGMDRIGKRITTAFKIRKVATGQNRWAIWRAEARFIQRWGNTRDQNFFFFNLLNNFLALHTEWLEGLAPSQYRRRYAGQARKIHQSANTIQRRTIIVSKDKMAARRLIFLLSAFLPGKYPNHASDARSQPDWSKTGYSDSPPKSQISRQQPFKRSTNRSMKEVPANGKISFQPPSKAFSNATEGHIECNFTDDQNTPQSSRRASDAKPVALLITSDGSVTRKSSTTTTTTVRADSASPVTYFATHINDCALNGPEGRRPSTSESFAAPLALKRTLSRSDSNEHSAISTDSHPGSVWGSLSKMWSSRRGSSTEASDRIASSEEGLGISGLSQVVKRPSTLNQMVAEVEQAKADQSAEMAHASGTQGQRRLPLRSSNAPHSASTGTSPLKHQAQMDPFPLKLSVDEDDGIIDVDLPQVDSLPSSFGSVASLPVAVHTAASSFNDRQVHHGSVPKSAPHHADSETNVAGWLRDWHEDFALQAVRPRKSLLDDIKGAMRRTPPSSNDEDTTDGWNEVSSTLIADTENFTLTRLSLRRRSKSSPHDQANVLFQNPTHPSQDEEIIEESLVDMDPVLTDAVEKVISHSGESSRVASQTPSRAPSPTRRRRSHEGRRHNNINSPRLEIHHSECRRMVLGALEQVAQSVSADIMAKDGGGKAIRKQGDRTNEFAESALREGIRKWFREVDSRSA